VYFEPTPLELVTALITESGKLERGAIAAAVHKRRELYKAAFQLC
jgi:translation initiation factor 2B subunit (eIF-2B alpha/beta/delta family)